MVVPATASAVLWDQAGADLLGYLVRNRLSAGLSFGVDQVPVYRDLVLTSAARDQINRFDPVTEVPSQCVRYTSGYGAVVSSVAVANLDLHRKPPCVVLNGVWSIAYANGLGKANWRVGLTHLGS